MKNITSPDTDLVSWQLDPQTMSFVQMDQSIEPILDIDQKYFLDGSTNWLNLVHDADKLPLLRSLTRSIECRRLTEVEFRIQTIQHEEKWLRASISIQSAADQSVRIQGTFEDISGRKISQRDSNPQTVNTTRYDELSNALMIADVGLNQTLDIDELLAQMAAQLKNLVPHDSLALLLVEDETLVKLFRTTNDITAGEGHIRDFSQFPHLALVVEQHTIVSIADTRADKRWKTIPGTRSIMSWLGLPLLVKGQTIGILNLNRHTLLPFSTVDSRIAMSFANRVALAVENARLYTMAKRHSEQILMLMKTASDINSILKIHDLLALIADRARSLVGAERSLIILCDVDERQITACVGSGYPDDKHQDLSFEEFESGISGWVLDEMTPLITSDLRLDKRNQGTALQKALNEPSPMRGKALAAAPLHIKGRAIGTIAVVNSASGFEFTQADLELMVLFANQAAIAVENATLYEAQQNYATDLERQVLARTESLTSANKELVKLSHRNVKFAQNVTHELNTPIANIQLTLDVLRLRQPEFFEQYLTKVDSQARRLQEIVKDVLQLSLLEEQANPKKDEAIDLNTLLTLLIADIQGIVDSSVTELSFEPEPDLPAIWGHEGHLRQIASNLVRNAVNYAPNGKISVRTCLVADDEGTWCTLEVSDEGNGIYLNDLPFIFDRFYRGRQSTDSSADGSGIGLAIVKELTEGFGGTVSVESKFGEGTQFTVKLPAMMPLPSD